MGFVSSFFQKLPLKPVAQLPLQTLDFMLQKLLLTHMVLYFKGGKLGADAELCTFPSLIYCYCCQEADYQGQKEGKYNIVKAYTTEESVHIPMAITTAETNEKIPDLHATVLQSAKKNEFFNPSTKKLLDTIAESSATVNKVPPPMTTAKTTLVFRTVPSEIGLNFAEANTSTLLPTNAPASP